MLIAVSTRIVDPVTAQQIVGMITGPELELYDYGGALCPCAVLYEGRRDLESYTTVGYPGSPGHRNRGGLQLPVLTTGDMGPEER